MNNPRGYILLFLFFAMISAYFFMRHQRKMNRHHQKVSSYRMLLTEKAVQMPFEIIRESRDAIVYSFDFKNKSYRSSSKAELYDKGRSQVYFLPEKPKVNSINPQAELNLLKSNSPSYWRFPLACILALSSIAFLIAFFSPVFRERMEYWMYQRRATKA